MGRVNDNQRLFLCNHRITFKVWDVSSYSLCNMIICHSCSQVHCVGTTVQMDRWTHRHCSILVWAHHPASPAWWAMLIHALMRKVHWLVTWRASVWTTTQAVYTTQAEATAPLITHRQTLLVSPRLLKEVGFCFTMAWASIVNSLFPRYVYLKQQC